MMNEQPEFTWDASVPPIAQLSQYLSAPLLPPSHYHSHAWFIFGLCLWSILHIITVPLYARVLDALWTCKQMMMKGRMNANRNRHRSGMVKPVELSEVAISDGNGTVSKNDDHTQHDPDASSSMPMTELSWGIRFRSAYHSLPPAKRAYWRRLFRSFLYYFPAIVFGFYFFLTYIHSKLDLYLVYTPGMDACFCLAAAHFLFCCIEDWPCRHHMGKTKCEQLAVFWGYIFHHLLTAGAYLMAVRTQQLASMCIMGLTFEGPVFFAGLREIVSLYDEDFNLFLRVPRWLFKLNWLVTFISLIPCRYVSIGLFFYSALNWRWYLQLVSPSARVCYWTFGCLFLFINVYFTWLLSYWYRQDERYYRKLKKRQADNAQALLHRKEQP